MRILVSAVEHHAVLDPAFWMAEHTGRRARAAARWTPTACSTWTRCATSCDQHGEQAALLSVMWANNEVGALQPLDEVVSLARRYGVPVHADAVQAVGQVPVDFAASGLDAMTVSGHKVGGPGGTGALLARRGLDLMPVQHGGGQERGVRSGTLDAALLVVVRGGGRRGRRRRAPSRRPRVAALRDELVAGVLAAVPDAVLRGPADTARRLPFNAHFTFPGCEGDSLLYLLDSAGVEASTGSACQAGVPRPSHVLLAMGVDEHDARGALRFSLGHTSSADDVAALVPTLPAVVDRARAAGLAGVR